MMRGPSIDVRPMLQFRPDSVWLGENRMVLTHGAALAELRAQLGDALGVEGARRILVHMGFTAGRCDGEMLRSKLPGRPVEEWIRFGPLLHGMEGLVRAQITKAEIDAEHGRFYVEGLWENSWEDELRAPSGHEGPQCWNQIGYVSGFCTALMGRLVVAREIECMGQGDERCTLVVQDADSLVDRDYLRYFVPDDMPLPPALASRAPSTGWRTGMPLPRVAEGLIGESRAFRAACELLSAAAQTHISVLLLGETGVGKEMFARWLHDNGPRAQQPFVAVNCAAIPGELIESELFGVERGAYTGAFHRREGRFQRADGGTLFLDEVGELAPQAQAKLLRVLQSGEVERLGGDRSFKVNVRVVAATNLDLQRAVGEKRFRADLYYRLCVYPIEIPPLRERRSDIVPIAEAFVEQFAREYHKPLQGLSERARTTLRSYAWPGNVRELQNVIERAVVLAPVHGQIELVHLGDALTAGARQAMSVDVSGHLRSDDEDGLAAVCERMLGSAFDLDRLVTALLRSAVDRADGNLSAAARLLGITRPQLAYRLKMAGQEDEPTAE